MVVGRVGPGQEGEVAEVKKEVQVRRAWVGDLRTIFFGGGRDRD